MVQLIDSNYISEINPDFIYNRFDLFCDNFIVLMAERGQEKHILEVRLFKDYAELGIWKMQITNNLLKEISNYIFQMYPNIGYTRFFFCNTNGKYNEVKHFSVLMVSEKYGTLIATCNPPKMIKNSNGANNVEKMFDYRQQLRNKFKK